MLSDENPKLRKQLDIDKNMVGEKGDLKKTVNENVILILIGKVSIHLKN